MHMTESESLLLYVCVHVHVCMRVGMGVSMHMCDYGWGSPREVHNQVSSSVALRVVH